MYVFLYVCVCGWVCSVLCYHNQPVRGMLLMSPHFFNFLSPPPSPRLCSSSLYCFSLQSPPSLIHPSISTPNPPLLHLHSLNNSGLQSLCIFGCCHLCRNTNTAHTSEHAHIYTYTWSRASTHAHTCRFTQTRLPTATKKVPDSVRPPRLANYEELSLQGFHCAPPFFCSAVPASKNNNMSLFSVSSRVTQNMTLK